MDFSKINLDKHKDVAREIVLRASKREFKDRRDFEKFRNSVVKELKSEIFHNLYLIKAYNDLLGEGIIVENSNLLKFIQKRGVRTMSGVAPVTVLTKPYPCPGKCVYCPTDVRMPKSYLPSQPAAQRAYRQGFNPYTQVFVRLRAMQMTGHEVSKVELRVIGGTFSSYPKSYQKWFIKRCLQAMNEFSEQLEVKDFSDMSNFTKTVVEESVYGKDEMNKVFVKSLKGGALKFGDVAKENENAKVKCIGINIETRPDFVDKKEARRLRELGVTKVEMGVQTVYDEIQEKTMRGHGLESVKRATIVLKNAGFKIGYHMMPNLPGSTPALDKKMIEVLFSDEMYQPDYLKIYPCVVVPKSKLAVYYRRNEYEPYNDRLLTDVLYKNLLDVPEWCRVDRVARDIPATDVEKGFKASNMRQILEKRAVDSGERIREIRFREIKGETPDSVEFLEREYRASQGLEKFLSYEDVQNDKIIALLRLRFPSQTFIKELEGAAIIREVHVYGKQIAVGKKSKGNKQHIGSGRKLIYKAEEISKANGFKKMAIIAGIGTREYYKKLGYSLEGTYMTKLL